MNNNLSVILAMGCSIPAILGAVKFKKATTNYKPFLLLMMVAVIAELIGGLPVIISNNYTPMRIAYPVYSLIEIFLWLLFFKLNKIFQSAKIIWAICLAGVVVYLVSLVIKHNIYNTMTNYCSTVFIIIIVLFSVKMLSNAIFETRMSAYKNPKMIIAFGCIFFYSFDLLESVFVYIYNPNGRIHLQIFLIHQIANILSYLIFTWAIIWIPDKTKY